MHKVADEVAAAIEIPLLHIADATAGKIIAEGVTKVGLLGTRFTMEQSFYCGRLSENHGIEVLVPDLLQRQQVHDIIYNELCLGEVNQGSRKTYLHIIDDLAQRGAEAVILGCTEIGLLVKPDDTAVTLFDTTEIHARSAVEMALT